MRLVLTVLALCLLVSVPATADSLGDYDVRGLSHQLDVRIGTSHDGLADATSTGMLTIDTFPRHHGWDRRKFDASGSHHHGFVAWGSGHTDPPRTRVPEPATLLLLGVGIAALVGVCRLRLV